MKNLYILLVALFVVNGATGQDSIPALSTDASAQSKDPVLNLQHRKSNSIEDIQCTMGDKDRKISDIFAKKNSEVPINHQIHQQRSLIQIYDSIFYWQWDTISNEWKNESKTIDIVYDENKNLTSELWQTWNGTTWVNYSQYTCTFDANNNPTSKLWKVWNLSYWTNDMLYTYTYDANNNLIIMSIQGWGSIWMNMIKYIYTYDGKNNRTSELRQHGGRTGSTWENSSQYLYTYDANNNQTSCLHQDWKNNAWENHWQYLCTYDASNNQISELDQLWNGSAWENDGQLLYYYDASNNLTSELGQYWNGSTWENNRQYLYTYDANNNQISELDQEWNGSTWENSRQLLYYYDASNNLTSQLNQEWNGSVWVNYIQYLFIYDADNFLIIGSYKMWNDAGTALMNGDSTYYYFHTNLGIYDLQSQANSLIIYPNPSTTTLTIENLTKGTLSILNLNRQQLLQQKITEPTTTIDVSTLPSGVYMVRLTSERTVQVEKFIKE